MSNIPIFSYKDYLDNMIRLKDQGHVDVDIQLAKPVSAGSRGLRRAKNFMKDKVHLMGEDAGPNYRPSPSSPNPTITEQTGMDKKPLDVPTSTIPEIAKKHGVDVQQIVDQVRKGVRVEAEHTTDFNTALEIALDHLKELPDYYDRLAQAEKPVAEGDLVAKRQSFYNILADKIREPQTGMGRAEHDPRILARVWQMLTGEKVEYDPQRDTYLVHKKSSQ